jgi:hypothetical protein
MKAPAPARSGRRQRTTIAKAASGKRASCGLGDQVLALATGKTQQEIAAACKGARPNHVGMALAPATSGLGASKSAMESPTPRDRRERSEAPALRKKRHPIDRS